MSDLMRVGFWPEIPDGPTVDERHFFPEKSRLMLEDICLAQMDSERLIKEQTDPTWRIEHPDEFEAVVQYLAVPDRDVEYRGYSSCRVCHCLNGSRTFFRDAFEYPEGYVHYLVEHGLRPPQEVVEAAMRAKAAPRLDNAVDVLLNGCPTHERCHVLEGLRNRLVEPWHVAYTVRMLRQGIGPCGEKVEDCQPGVRELIRELVAKETERIRGLWQAFHGGQVQIDFVCANHDKLKAIREAMEVSDVVPLTFSLKEIAGDRVRFIIEI